MTLNIKPVLFLPFIVLGSIFFYDGYENLIQINNLNETLKNEVKFEIKNNKNIINKKIIKKSNKLLKRNGKLIFEIGEYQSMNVKNILNDNGYYINKVVNDISSVPRVIISTKIN